MNNDLYGLKGEHRTTQVEPSAAYWSQCPILRTVTVAEIENKLKPFKPYPTDPAADWPVLSILANEETRKSEVFFKNHQVNPQSVFLSNKIYFQEPPSGAVLKKTAIEKGVSTGLELATLFEAETPGLWHRHILNMFFDPRKLLFVTPTESNPPSPADLSPPLQALVWAALETAISSALMAAWHFKWAVDTNVSYRQRPWEAENKDGLFNVLYDTAINFNKGDPRFYDSRSGAKQSPPSPSPGNTPGTPRHPAYPSGHSTYSAAASYVLGHLFPMYKDEFKKLANNIGWARVWGGVHWPSDHAFGRDVGEAIGALILQQMDETAIQPAQGQFAGMLDVPPPDTLQRSNDEFAKCDKTMKSMFSKNGVWPPQSTDGKKDPVRQQNQLI